MWPLIGTQSPGGVWLAEGGRGGGKVGEELRGRCVFVNSEVAELQVSELAAVLCAYAVVRVCV